SFVGILLAGFLILLFAIWGIEDIFRPGVSRNTTVIQVGDVKMTGQEFQNLYQRMVPLWQRRLQTTIDYQTAKRLGIVNQLIENTVSSALFALGAKNVGVAVSDEVVRRDIRADRRFRNVAGQFDRRVFQAALQSLRLGEAGYVAERRNDIARGQLAGAVASIGFAPKSYLQTLLRFRNEKRVVEIVTVTNASIDGIKEPDEGTSRKFHKDNAVRFTAPPLRKATAIVVPLADVAKEIKVSDEEIKTAYESRRAEFVEPERRTVRQILLRDEAKAKKVHEAIKGGKSFDDAAKEVAGSPALSLGKLKKADLPIKALGDAAFALAKDGVSGPVKSPLGWHILQVTEIEPGKTKTVADVRRVLIKDLRKEKAVDAIDKLRESLDDEIGGGAKLEDAAKKLNLKLVVFEALDARGNDANGTKVKDLPPDRTFLIELLKLDAGSESLIVDMSDGGFFVVRADKLTPSKLRPFAKIKKRVAEAWKEAERQKAAKVRAEKMAAKIKGGEKIAIVAAAEGLTMRTTKPITRGTPGRSSRLSRTFQAKLFEAKQDVPVTGPVPGGYAVGVVTKIEAPGAATSKKDLENLSRRLRTTVATELLLQYSESLRSQHKVEINQTAIDGIFNPRDAN
ncbi:MAG: peptidyl-prolyl cis-trans isomerase, partial [Pseudomonadota bacterium]